jgi:glycine cleavage system H protein
MATKKKTGAPREGEFEEGKLFFSRKGGVVVVSLTASAAEEIGSVESVSLPSEDDRFEKGDVVATVEGTTGTLEVPAPAGGVIVSVNDNLESAPELASEDPLETGWLFELEMEDSTELLEYAEGEEEVEISGGED